MSDTRIAASLSLRDPSLLAVILGNLISIVLAYIQQWPLGEIMWVYWSQSVIIGVMNVFRMLALKEFTTKGLTSNGQPVPETQAAKREIAGFFALHYGFFHFGYAVFLWQQMPLHEIPIHHMMFMMIGISGFVGTHSYSLLHNLGSDFKDKRPNLGTLMFYPYMRIVPMHLAIIFGGMISGLGLPLFMGMKLLADAGTHMVEHHLFRKPGAFTRPEGP